MKFKNLELIILLAFTSCFLNSCVETFDFEKEVETFESALVIEATLTNELKNQHILLSRTFQLDTVLPIPESHAFVKVIDNFQNEYVFQESGAGTYISTTAFEAVPNRDYKLKITTADGRSYSSKMLQLTQRTQIDKIDVIRGFNDDGVEGISILVNSYDPSGKSRYYRYEYEETYKIIAPRYSAFEIVFEEGSFFDYTLGIREEQERVCYNTVKSNTIIQASTINLADDRLEGFTARFINRDNYIMSHRYSILVRQYVQSEAAYNFYSILKEISESESLLSQSQPGQVIGNVFSEDSQEELVLGYFEVSTVSEERIYFNYADYFPDEDLPPYIVGCDTFIAPDLATMGMPPGHPLYDHVAQGFQFFHANDGSIVGDFLNGPEVLVLPECGDCTTLGKNIAPDFWIE